MNIIYDFVWGSGDFAAGVTDVLPNMLQVTWGLHQEWPWNPDKKGSPRRWRSVHTGYSQPFWAKGFTSAEMISRYVLSWAQKLPRSRQGQGTMVVQVREQGPSEWWLSLGHTTERFEEYANAGPETCLPGWPAGV